MTARDIFNHTSKLIKSNTPEILTALGVSGLFTTSYLVGKASYRAAKALEHEPEDLSVKDVIKHTWRLYIPSGVSGAITVGCIVGASKSESKRTAAAVTAYSLGERAFAEYREKVVEHIGKGPEQKVRDEIAQDRITQNPPTSTGVVIIGDGNVLCCELRTGRYFRSDMETLRKAQNDTNEDILNDLYVTLDEFYDRVGLEHTSGSDVIGWNEAKVMRLDFSTVLAPGGEPCLAFDYNYIKPLD